MRCKCCNEPLSENEIIWKQDIQQHEDMCYLCRRAVYVDVQQDDIAIVNDNIIVYEE